MFWTLFTFTVSSWVLAAHFLRSGATLLAAIAVLLPLIFFIKKPWVPIVVQIYLYPAAALWLLVAYNIAKQRIAMNDDWLRMAMILGSVAAFTLLSALLVNRKSFKERYSGETTPPNNQTTEELAS